MASSVTVLAFCTAKTIAHTRCKLNVCVPLAFSGCLLCVLFELTNKLSLQQGDFLISLKNMLLDVGNLRHSQLNNPVSQSSRPLSAVFQILESPFSQNGTFGKGPICFSFGTPCFRHNHTKRFNSQVAGRRFLTSCCICHQPLLSEGDYHGATGHVRIREIEFRDGVWQCVELLPCPPARP